MKKGHGTLVVALGGNALSPPGAQTTVAEQFRYTRKSLLPVIDLAADGWRIAVVHGNGPQVGDELARNEMAREQLTPLPLGILVAVTAGWLGYMIQQSLKNALLERDIERDVITLITQTIVDRNDPLLADPTKPIGHKLDEAKVRQLQANGVPVKQDSRGRWRRMAPSPRPLGVVELEAVKQLVNEGKLVIAAGGGGPPVYWSGSGWDGIDAVVDKDLTASALADALDADVLLILTNVDAVYRNWHTEQQERIAHLDVTQARQLVESGSLAAGSIGPKVEAARCFVERGLRRKAIIAHLEDGSAALKGEAGTVITGDGK